MDETALAKELGRRFLQRRTTKARQFPDGHYEPVHEPWVLDDLRNHLSGQATWGHYLVDDANLCRIAAFDIDLRAKGQWRESCDDEWHDIEPRKVWTEINDPSRDLIRRDLGLQLRCLAEGLALRTQRNTSLPVTVAYSGNKGMHVYVFFANPVPAMVARTTLEDILVSFNCFDRARGEFMWQHRDGYRCLEIEVFPKQDTVRPDGGLGNLLRLPLGIHQKSRQWSYFVDLETSYDKLVPDDPAAALSAGSLRRPVS